MFWNQYPYINLNDLNLDFLLKAIGEMQNEVENFVTLNAVKYADPIQWNITKQYQKNTIVIDPLTGTAYISTKTVPSGVALNDTNYWTVVFDLSMFITQANENLTEHVEGAGIVYSTFVLNVGDWVIWNGVLYKALVTMPIGTAYSVGGNIERVTVEDYIKNILTTIANEVQARIDADSTLQEAIDDEVQARKDADGNLSTLSTTNKSNLVDAINEIYSMASDLNAGIYNNTTPDSGLTTNIGLKEGVYNVTSNLTINAQLVLPKGAIIDVANGVTLTINGQILAGRYQIFSGNGDIVVDSKSQPIGFPEWFGAIPNGVVDCTNAIQKCINVFSATSLSIGKYRTTSTLIINQPNKKFYGILKNQFNNIIPENVSTIYPDFDGIAIRVGNDTFTGAGLNLNYCYLSNFIIYFDESDKPNAIGLKIQYTFTCKFNNIAVYNAVNGYNITGVVDTFLEHCVAWRDTADNVFQLSSNFVAGFYIDSNPDIGLAGGNASLYLNYCTATFHIGFDRANAIGFYCAGSPADIFMQGCETSGGAAGFQFLITGNALEKNSDVKLTNCIADACTFAAYMIGSDTTIIRVCMIDIINCWGACLNNSPSSLGVLYLSYVRGVSIIGGSLNALQNSTNLRIVHAKQISVEGLKVAQGTYGVYVEDVDHAKIDFSAMGSTVPLNCVSGAYLLFREDSIGGQHIYEGGREVPQSTDSNMNDYVYSTIKILAPITV